MANQQWKAELMQKHRSQCFAVKVISIVLSQTGQPLPLSV